MFKGPVLKLLIRPSLPIFAEMVFQLLYNITDTIWISRRDLDDPSYVGGTGISSRVARSFGQQNPDLRQPSYWLLFSPLLLLLQFLRFFFMSISLTWGHTAFGPA